MTAIKIPRHATILVCDARKALLLSNHGDEDLPDIRLIEVLQAEPNPKAEKQGTDRPGRLSDGAGGTHRNAVEQTNWHDRAETDFAIRLTSLLAERHGETPYSALIIVAPPVMLGDLRKHMPAAVAKAVVTELDKDLVNVPVDEIERALTGR